MITIRPVDDRAAYQPGERVEVDCEWTLDSTPVSMEARLVWFAHARNTGVGGYADQELIARNPISPRQAATERISFSLPAGPYSCVGQLLSVGWAIIVATPNKRAIWPFALAPGGPSVDLDDRPDVHVER
jgi:hypothetical protein